MPLGRAAPEACSVVHPQTRERLQAYGLSYEQANACAEPGCAGLSDVFGDCGESFGQGAGLVVFLDDAGQLVGAPVGEL